MRDASRIVLPPANFAHEEEKISQRWPAAIDFIRKRQLNEFLGSATGDVGLIVQGGVYNTLIRALELLKLSDSFGDAKLPIYVLNVTYPLVHEEVVGFCADKKAVLLIEEGQPDFLEQNVNSILRKADIQTKVIGKDVLPLVGEYTGQVLKRGLESFLTDHAPEYATEAVGSSTKLPDVAGLDAAVPARPPGMCTGCPERPVFTAMKLLEREIGKFHVSCDIGCHLFSVLPPFNIGNTTMGYGLGWAGASAFNVEANKRVISVMGDGGFWHNGLTSGVGNAVFNNNDNVLVIVDNDYSAATGGQDLLSSRRDIPNRSTRHTIVDAVRGLGVKWVRLVHNYDLGHVLATLREAMTTKELGPKIIVAHGECQLNRQRRVAPQIEKHLKDGRRIEKERFGVDEDLCTGDHSCIRLSGCPSLTIKPNPDPLRTDPVAHVDNSCVGCGVCGEVAHAAVLCPSFYRTTTIENPSPWDRFLFRMRRAVIDALQRRADRRRPRYEPA